MPRVIGIPLSKGNGEEVIAVQILDAEIDDMFEGRAVAMVDGSPVSGEKVVSTDLTTGFYGFIMDINKCSRMASVVRSANGVYLPSNGGTGFTSGDAVTIDESTGLIDPAGGLITNGVIDLAGATQGLDGKTGEAVTDCVSIRISGARQVS